MNNRIKSCMIIIAAMLSAVILVGGCGGGGEKVEKTPVADAVLDTNAIDTTASKLTNGTVRQSADSIIGDWPLDNLDSIIKSHGFYIANNDGFTTLKAAMDSIPDELRGKNVIYVYGGGYENHDVLAKIKSSVLDGFPSREVCFNSKGDSVSSDSSGFCHTIISFPPYPHKDCTLELSMNHNFDVDYDYLRTIYKGKIQGQLDVGSDGNSRLKDICTEEGSGYWTNKQDISRYKYFMIYDDYTIQIITATTTLVSYAEPNTGASDQFTHACGWAPLDGSKRYENTFYRIDDRCTFVQ